MSKSQLIALIFIFSALGIISGLLFIRFIHTNQPTAGLKVESVPDSVVFVDNVQVGRTPLDKLLPPGEITVRLVPETTSSDIAAYQTKVRLVNKVYTVIHRDFGQNESQSAGETITLSPYSGSQSSLGVTTSDPESALVSVDGLSQGFSPISLDAIAASNHQIEISSPGYETRLITATTVNGYLLSVSVKLAAKSTPAPVLTFPTIKPTPIATISGTLIPTPKSAVLPKPYVKISSTPTGFLRVRSAPSLSGVEVGQVKPGDTYPLLNQTGGWILIQAKFTATSSGWISSDYAQVFK